MEMVPQQYCLRWKHHHSNVQNMFAQLLEKERFCDVTLYCSPSFATQVQDKDTVDPQNIRGVSLRAHRVVLAACSEMLGSLLGAHESQGEPVLVIDGAEPRHLRALLDYMYTGEMNVHHSQLAGLLKTAEELRIKGLTDIRWNNKDEPPDSHTGAVTATTTSDKKTIAEQKSERKRTPERNRTSPDTESVGQVKKEEASDTEGKPGEKFNVNGGPPPLIKLPIKEKRETVKRENSDTESPSPKRQRMTGTEHLAKHDEESDDDEPEQEWQHGNMDHSQDITAERVVQWCAGEAAGGGASGGGDEGGGSWERDASDDDEWADAPADIGSFLRTRLRVDGDDSADEESNDGAPPSTSSSAGTSAVEMRMDTTPAKSSKSVKPALGPLSGPSDPRFTDVVKLNDYLRYGRRPQFWEENYVKRVMEAVRIKELEMKQAAEILGVSYGTLYGRYRDVYGCINRPYRTARDFWQAKGPSELLERLQRGEVSLDAGASALGVSASHLAAYLSDIATPCEKEFEPIPIEIDPSIKMKVQPYTTSIVKALRKTVNANDMKNPKKIVIGSLTDEDPIPATVISTHDVKKQLNTVTTTATSGSGKWPSIRVASLDTLRGSETPSPSASPSTAPASPTLLMRTRPDLTIVAAKRADAKRADGDANT